MENRIPTSVVLEALLQDAPLDWVTLDWIVAHLSERSIAFQMILARPGPILPRIVASRRVSTPRLARLIEGVVPVLKHIERLVRPRWQTPFKATKRAVGFIILLLGATLLAPIPFSHVIPAIVIMLLAFAFLESDGVLLCVALLAGIISFCTTIAAAWGAIAVSLAI
jgi:hypothetical protein